MDGCDILGLFPKTELLREDENFEDYLVSVQDKSFCVLSLSYEYDDTEINYQTSWFDSKEDAIKKYKEDLDI